MSKYNRQLGNQGEAFACNYLLEMGYAIVARNWRCGHLEVDIIAQEGSTAHIVEVKTRAASQGLDLDVLLPLRKQKSLLAAAEAYSRRHDWVDGVQIDLIAILWEGGIPTIEFYEDAVLPHF